MSEPVGEKHVDETEKHWVDADPSGRLVVFLCDILQGYVAGDCKLGPLVQQVVKERCKAVGLNPLHVWNALVALAHTLPRKIG
ncbi:hypothetical protein LCGC14_2691100 [marine sediment metagenome]|uniref:Uncharacterized protein n=1 Tax=marine sediment metagenome TaxID=412755 RepID=A0A0F9BT70_9ZZZZ